MSSQDTCWKVVGGQDTAGLVVRVGQALNSPAAAARLGHGAIVREQDRRGNRLHYSLVSGLGPRGGWVSIQMKGKSLLERLTRPELEDQFSTTSETGGKGELARPQQHVEDKSSLAAGSTAADADRQVCCRSPEDGVQQQEGTPNHMSQIRTETQEQKQQQHRQEELACPDLQQSQQHHDDDDDDDSQHQHLDPGAGQGELEKHAGDQSLDQSQEKVELEPGREQQQQQQQHKQHQQQQQQQQPHQQKMRQTECQEDRGDTLDLELNPDLDQKQEQGKEKDVSAQARGDDSVAASSSRNMKPHNLPPAYKTDSISEVIELDEAEPTPTLQQEPSDAVSDLKQAEGGTNDTCENTGTLPRKRLISHAEHEKTRTRVYAMEKELEELRHFKKQEEERHVALKLLEYEHPPSTSSSFHETQLTNEAGKTILGRSPLGCFLQIRECLSLSWRPQARRFQERKRRSPTLRFKNSVEADDQVRKKLARNMVNSAEQLQHEGNIKEAGRVALELQEAAFELLKRLERRGAQGLSVLNDDDDEQAEKPRSELACTSHCCAYLVHSDEKFGSYCCVNCYESYGAEHGQHCQRKLAPKPQDDGSKQTSEGQDQQVPDEKRDGSNTAKSSLKEKNAQEEAGKDKEETSLGKEELAAKAALNEAKQLALRIQDTVGVLFRDSSKAAATSPSAAAGQDLLGDTVQAGKACDKLALVKGLQEAASTLLKDGLLDRAREMAKKLQDTAFSLLTEDVPEETEAELETKTKKPKGNDELKDDEVKRAEDWRADIQKRRRERDQEGVAQLCQDAAAAMLEQELYQDAQLFAKDAVNVFRSIASRWRLGVALDYLASANVGLFKQMTTKTEDAGKRPQLRESPEDVRRAALEASNESVKLLVRIGHPKEEADLARARTTLASVRGLFEEAAGARSRGKNGQTQSEGRGEEEEGEEGQGREGRGPAPSSEVNQTQIGGSSSSTDPGLNKAEVHEWKTEVARQRRLFRQAPVGRGDSEGLAQTLYSAAKVFLKHGSRSVQSDGQIVHPLLQAAIEASEEAVEHFRKLGAGLRLGRTLELVAKVHLSCREAYAHTRIGDRSEALLWVRQHHLKCKTAALESVSILSQRTSADWLGACASARCTHVALRALEHERDDDEDGDVPEDLGGAKKRLRKTFGYGGGMEKPVPFARFDISDESCLLVGGFKHGQEVEDIDKTRYVVIGAKICDEDDYTPRLYFQPLSLKYKAACHFHKLARRELELVLKVVGSQPVEEARPEDFDTAEDSEGEAQTLCGDCMLPVGATKYTYKDGEGVCHGECMAKLLLDASRAEELAREKADTKKKLQDRQEYGIGWRPDRMIPRNTETLRRRRIPCPEANGKPNQMFSLVLEGSPPKLRVRPTTDPEAFVNIAYLLTALQVRIRANMAPYFSLDTPHSDEPWQVKTFGPHWIKGTEVGEVLFQADYHLKELSMGDSLFEQPVVGMKNCWDFDWKSEAWRGREWFVVKHANVVLSDNNVLIPDVKMGVEAREQVVNTQKQLVDAPVTSKTHPLVKYAEMFSHNFELIAERKSVVYQLREISKAAVIAKFLVDNKVVLEDCWLRPDDHRSLCKMDLPFNKKERYRYEILVRDGRIHEQHGGVLSSMVGLYGGVDLNIDAFDLSLPFSKLPRSTKAPDYSAIYGKGSETATKNSMGRDRDLFQLSLYARTASLPSPAQWTSGQQKQQHPVVRRLLEARGEPVAPGPVEKEELIERLSNLEQAAAQDAAPSTHDELTEIEESCSDLPYAAALADDLRHLQLAEDSVQSVLKAVRSRAAGEDPATSEGLKSVDFWKELEAELDEKDASSPSSPRAQQPRKALAQQQAKASLFRRVFDPQFSDRAQEGQLFVPPSVKDAYLVKLKSLLDEEEKVQQARRQHFLSPDFDLSRPGPLFPSTWRPTFSMHFGRGSSVCAKGSSSQGLRWEPVAEAANLAKNLKIKPHFEGKTEDGRIYRIYRKGPHELRSIQAGPNEEDEVCQILKATAFGRLSDKATIVKATEYVSSGRTFDEESSAAASTYVYFVSLETDLGESCFVQKISREAPAAWEELPPAYYEDRLARARVSYVVDCGELSKTVADLRRKFDEASKTLAHLSSRRFASVVVSWLGGTTPTANRPLPPPAPPAEVEEEHRGLPPNGSPSGMMSRPWDFLSKPSRFLPKRLTDSDRAAPKNKGFR